MNSDIDYTEIEVACQLCGRWMRVWQYDEHFDKCLDIEYLVRTMNEHGEDITREDLEGLSRESINKLLKKHEPKKVEL